MSAKESKRVKIKVGQGIKFSFDPDGNAVDGGFPYVLVDIVEDQPMQWTWTTSVTQCPHCQKAIVKQRKVFIHTVGYYLPMEKHRDWMLAKDTPGLKDKLVMIGFASDGKVLRLDDSVKESRELRPILMDKSDEAKERK